MDVEKNQKEIPTQEETVKTSNKPIKEAPKNPKINEKCSNTASSLGEQKSEEKESFKKQTENLKEGLIKLKKLQREDTNVKEIMKNQEQDKHQTALEEVITKILTITMQICLYKFSSIFRRKKK